MRRTSPSRPPALGVSVAVAAWFVAVSMAISPTVAGTPSPDAAADRAKEKAKEKAKAKAKSAGMAPKVDETIGDLTSIYGNDVKVEGVGLVINLDGTGSEPAPSWQQKKLVEEMQKAGLDHPEKLLRSPNVSLVVVRAMIPAGVSKADKFDVDIELPNASATSSLAGGWLVSTRLAQRAKTKDGEKDDKVIGTALGPVMIGNYAQPGNPKVGRVLGGGRSLEDSPYLLSIKEQRRSGKTSQLIENVVKQRFHQVDNGNNKGMAEAKTDAALILKVPRVYHHNQARYHLIISKLNLVDNPDLREKRLAAWGKELLDPKTAGLAAIKLEGLGPVAIPALKQGLESSDPTVKFLSAESLGYLNNSDAAATLADVARTKPEFRAYAFKAMAATDQSASLLKLRTLMNDPEPQVRYGAFDALRTLDPNDPFLGKVRVLPPPKAPDPDDMALAVDGGRRFRPASTPAEDPFSLYVVDSDGPPMIHVTQNIRCEVVIFGKGQMLLTPIVLGSGGPLLLNAADGDDKVQICKIVGRGLDGPPRKINSTLDAASIVRAMTDLGASYPDVVSILAAASAQKNLPGAFAVDALSPLSKAYDEIQYATTTSPKKDDAIKKASNPEERKSLMNRLFGR